MPHDMMKIYIQYDVYIMLYYDNMYDDVDIWW